MLHTLKVNLPNGTYYIVANIKSQSFACRCDHGESAGNDEYRRETEYASKEVAAMPPALLKGHIPNGVFAHVSVQAGIRFCAVTVLISASSYPSKLERVSRIFTPSAIGVIT